MNAQALLRRAMTEPARVLAQRVRTAVASREASPALQVVEKEVRKIGKMAGGIADLAVRVHGERVLTNLEEVEEMRS